MKHIKLFEDYINEGKRLELGDFVLVKSLNVAGMVIDILDKELVVKIKGKDTLIKRSDVKMLAQH